MDGHMEKGKFHPHGNNPKKIHSSSVNSDMSTHMNDDKEKKSLKVDDDKISDYKDRIEIQWDNLPDPQQMQIFDEWGQNNLANPDNESSWSRYNYGKTSLDELPPKFQKYLETHRDIKSIISKNNFVMRHNIPIPIKGRFGVEEYYQQNISRYQDLSPNYDKPLSYDKLHPKAKMVLQDAWIIDHGKAHNIPKEKLFAYTDKQNKIAKEVGSG